ncbi:hypothetical protein EPA93_43325 [Ktedonosporobacter rubrisoli]|uniref:Uncharacterized protein n=1 Tax=Ktedonosporobacter rubrisoli TaxID=2509675 RepID=A0A4P6K2K5_KTERU|nr:hypothetical protein [Ktedonosporobacter rubrisoli]QBD82448.1 hypothetical protein EPA93_43325 [Ktedonosporobacter rubrisoli]
MIYYSESVFDKLVIGEIAQLLASLFQESIIIWAQKHRFELTGLVLPATANNHVNVAVLCIMVLHCVPVQMQATALFERSH